MKKGKLNPILTSFTGWPMRMIRIGCGKPFFGHFKLRKRSIPIIGLKIIGVKFGIFI
jgi:hypothetical protein